MQFKKPHTSPNSKGTIIPYGHSWKLQCKYSIMATCTQSAWGGSQMMHYTNILITLTLTYQSK